MHLVQTSESPALRGFVAERGPVRGTSLYLVLLSNGQIRGENLRNGTLPGGEHASPRAQFPTVGQDSPGFFTHRSQTPQRSFQGDASGTHATRPPNRAHSGSHGETQGLLSPSATAWLCAVSEIATERTAGESGCTPYGVYPLSPASRPRWAAQFFCASAKLTRSVAIAFILWYDKLAS